MTERNADDQHPDRHGPGLGDGGGARARAEAQVADLIRRTRRRMALERAVAAFWPLAVLIGAVWSLVAFGALLIATQAQAMGALALAGLAGLVLLVAGIRRFRWPSSVEARARLDRGEPSRPLTTLVDSLALGREDAATSRIWALNRDRLLARAARLTPPRPDLRLAARDPYATRLAVAVAVIAALLFAPGDGWRSLTRAPGSGTGEAAAAGPAFEAWVRPPAYTGRPTIYLPEVRGDLTQRIPQGSEITLRAYGPPAGFALSESVTTGPEATLETVSTSVAAAAFTLERSGSVTLERGGEVLGNWSFVMQPDLPPAIELAEPVGRVVTGAMQLRYEARDDYGVTAARAEIALDLDAVERRHGLAAEPVRRAPITVDLPLPISGGRDRITETLIEDFSDHPWAGLPVRITLEAEDALEQTGRSDAYAAELPMRRFFDPLAASLVEQRRDLLWSPENARRVVRILRAVSYLPEEVFDSERAFLLTRVAIRRLDFADRAGHAAEVVDDVADLLWRAALLIEDGEEASAAERLARARERLAEALQGDATDDEIAQLMDELRQATRDYLDQLTREALDNRDFDMSGGDGDFGRGMNQDQIQELMDRIQELSEQGRRAEAEELLALLAELLDNLDVQIAEGGGGGEAQGLGQQALEDMAESLREQQELADDTFQELQRQFDSFRPGPDGAPPGQGPGAADEGDGPGRGTLAERQEALRSLADQLAERMPGQGDGTREALREAERHMGAARDDLERGDTAQALDRQADALEALREGMRRFQDEMRMAEGSAGQGEEGGAEAFGQTDPLGRPSGSRGTIGTSDPMLPEADSAARARELMDEIRRRSSELGRPAQELDYLRRLLDRF